jgi:hypothetical protein
VVASTTTGCAGKGRSAAIAAPLIGTAAMSAVIAKACRIVFSLC